ncbi:MAG: putative DNA-binding protein [Xanthobacteraceae bacterium]|nr:putative DNA-binding protein [Xanthobacteraceae bacterium]
MSALAQSHFAEALLDADRAIPPDVTSHTTRVPARRFGVYRNNVVASLVNALRIRFPAVARIVGDEFFAGMARLFVTAQPPRSPLLMRYGDAFPDFIAGFTPAAELLYLPDVARVEAARTRAYHAADMRPLDLCDIATQPPETLGALRVSLHPSIEIVRSAFPVVTIWAMNSGEAELTPIDDWRGEDALVARPALDVEMRALPAGGAAFLRALFNNETLGQAATLALADSDQFDLAANLAGLFGAGLVVAIEHSPLMEPAS